MVEAGAAHRRVHPGRLRRLLADPSEPGDRRPRRRRADRGVRHRGDRRVDLRHPRHGRHRPPAGRAGGQADRAAGDPRHHHRASRGVRAAGHRRRGWSLRLGAAVYRDHDRAAASLPRPPRPHPPLPHRRLGTDRRAGHPRRHDVRQVARRDHRLRRGCRAAGYRRRRFPRPRPPPARSPVKPGRAQREGTIIMPEADSHTATFRPFFNPATGEWITYTAIAADNHGQLVRFNWRSVPGGVITEHIHPHQEERFTIMAGEAHFTLGGEQRVATAGETIVVPAGVPHSEGNPGPGEIEGVVELRPALLTKEFHEALAGLVADGKTTPRGAPKNPLQLGATFWHFRHESRISSPPIVVQHLMLPSLWALAKLVGIRPYYDHWDSRI